MSNKKVKAGIWYTVSNFFVKGIVFLTTPIFTRLMTVDDYGQFSNFTAWRNILISLLTMELSASINRARFDYDDDLEGYISSISTLSIIIPLIFAAIVEYKIDYFSSLFKLENVYLRIMVWSIVFAHTFDIYITEKIINYRYITNVLLSLVNTIGSLIASIILVIYMDNQLLGRIIGQVVPTSILGIVLYLRILYKGKNISLDKMKYAVKVSLPFIPHILAANLLNQSDRIIIIKYDGAESSAMYSVGCTASLLISVLLTSLNAAWTPWMGEKLFSRDFNSIKNKSRPYALLFVVAYIGALLVSPELLQVLGGKKYDAAIGVMPPLITSTMIQFLYTQYVNIEQFEKKMWRVALITAIAAIINIVGNILLVPVYGYIAAAYTTLISMVVMWLLNYCSVKFLHLEHSYDNVLFAKIGCGSIFMCFMAMFVYECSVVRYLLIVVYVIMALLYFYKYRKRIISIIKKGE